MPKVHRLFLDRVTGYADEAGAFVRRRRLTRRPFARVYCSGGRAIEHSLESEAGDRLMSAAEDLLLLAGEGPR